MYTKNAILILLFASVSKKLSAQPADVASQLMESNKLYAVIAVFAVILVGLFVFLFYLEQRIRKLEQDNQ